MHAHSHRIAAVAALALLAVGCAAPGTPGYERRFLRTLQSGSARHKREALVGLSGPLTPAMREAVTNAAILDADPYTCAMAADALARFGTAESAEVLEAVAHGDQHWMVRRRALRALAAILREDSAEALNTSLRLDDEPAVRVEALLLAARELPPRTVAEMALRALADRAPEVSITAQQRLAELTGRDIPPGEIEAWKKAVEQWGAQSHEGADGR